MVSEIDDQDGRIMLDPEMEGLMKNILIIFSGENGIIEKQKL
jgi:hypothetical protein